ncbi:MAG: efflux RND transporter periplasmic adaptor subunit [Albidovulum sp.]|uniref:efflux RND transporter periplasmic adaptor subunit n=1 Tax=Albidovulum sp. TaxID=1872424 RepID=UPI003C8D7CB8
MKPLFILMVLSLALPAAAETPTTEATAAPRPVVSVIVRQETALPVSYVGTVVAGIQTDLGFPLPGTIAERPVSAGDIVRSGELLARLDPENLDTGLRAAEAGVVVATAQLRSATDARDRAQKLAQRGVGSETRLEDAERALVAATSQLEQAEAIRTRAADILGLATLTAPQSGVVTAVHAEQGTTLSAGQPVLTLAATDAREIVIDLAERDVAAMEPGTAFVAELVANPDLRAHARLDRIDPVAERTTRTRRLHLVLDAPPETFRLGALTRVSPAAGPDAGVVLPATALLESGRASSVWVVDRDDDTVRQVPVTIGMTIAEFVLVADGLEAGSEVVVKGVHSLTEGQKVGPRMAE